MTESTQQFTVVNWELDEDTRQLSLRYRLGDIDFEEVIQFESQPSPEHAEHFESSREALARAVTQLHIACGTSYFKAAMPNTVDVQTPGVSARDLSFHHQLYDEGLRELAVRNGIDVPVDVTLTGASDEAELDELPVRMGSRTVVPIGGGKDSLVVVEALRPLRPRLFAVNPHPLVVKLAADAGMELLIARRRIDPLLIELNSKGAINGHVPITGIVSLIAVVGSYFYDYDQIVMSIERSASEETTTVGSVSVNHQFSKSLDFEISLRNFISQRIDPRLGYGSALRPYSELVIARGFAKLKSFHSTFCSCNTVFRRDADPDKRWCGNCPKCRFVGLMLAPFLSREEISRIVGTDMFVYSDQIDGFAALLSDEEKPFECVGERRESAVAVLLLEKSPDWATTPVIEALAPIARRLLGSQPTSDIWEADDRLAFPDPQIAALVSEILS